MSAFLTGSQGGAILLVCELYFEWQGSGEAHVSRGRVSGVTHANTTALSSSLLLAQPSALPAGLQGHMFLAPPLRVSRPGTKHENEAACSQGQEQVGTSGASRDVCPGTCRSHVTDHLGLVEHTDPQALLSPTRLYQNRPWESVFVKSGPGDSDPQPGWQRGSWEERMATCGSESLSRRDM